MVCVGIYDQRGLFTVTDSTVLMSTGLFVCVFVWFYIQHICREKRKLHLVYENAAWNWKSSSWKWTKKPKTTGTNNIVPEEKPGNYFHGFGVVWVIAFSLNLCNVWYIFVEVHFSSKIYNLASFWTLFCNEYKNVEKHLKQILLMCNGDNH